MGCKTCGGKTAQGSFQQREALRQQEILRRARASNGGTNVVGGVQNNPAKDYTDELKRQQDQN